MNKYSFCVVIFSTSPALCGFYWSVLPHLRTGTHRPNQPTKPHTGQLRPIHPPALPCKSFCVLRSSLARPPLGRAGVLFAGGRSPCSALFQCVFYCVGSLRLSLPLPARLGRSYPRATNPSPSWASCAQKPPSSKTGVSWGRETPVNK